MTQKNESLFDGTPTSLLGRTLCTPLRCHAFSATIAVLMIGCMAVVLQSKNWFAKDTLYSEEQVDDSIALLAKTVHWRKEHARLVGLSKATQGKIATTRQWLPVDFDWRDAEDQIAAIAIRTNVQIVMNEQGESHRGSRVGIKSANCIIEGSYENICLFLGQLPNADHPVWCSSVRLVRQTLSGDATNHCTATLQLRLPYAADGTVSDKLFAAGPQHAS